MLIRYWCRYSVKNAPLVWLLFILTRFRSCLNLSFENLKYNSYLFYRRLYSNNSLNEVTQFDHSDRRNGALYGLKRLKKRLNSGRKRWKRGPFFTGFRAVIRHFRLRNVFHRNGKRRRFMPFPPNNGELYWHRFLAVSCLKYAVIWRLRLYLVAFIRLYCTLRIL